MTDGGIVTVINWAVRELKGACRNSNPDNGSVPLTVTVTLAVFTSVPVVTVIVTS